MNAIREKEYDAALDRIGEMEARLARYKFRLLELSLRAGEGPGAMRRLGTAIRTVGKLYDKTHEVIGRGFGEPRTEYIEEVTT